MAVNFYVEQADRSSQSGIATEAVEAGTLVSDTGSGVATFAFADGDYEGLALYDPEYLAADEPDEVAPDGYSSGERVRYHPSEDGAIVKIRTLTDDGGPAPSIGHQSVVGVIDDSSADAPTGVQGRIVEEGYSADISGDGTATTFSRSNSNFVAIGRAYRPGQMNGDTITDYDAPVRVRLFAEAEA